MHVSKQWTDEGRTARKSGSGPRNVTSARDDRHLVRMAQTDRTSSSRQLAAQWSTATGVSLCAPSIRRRLLQRELRARIPLYRIPLTQNHRHLSYNGPMCIGAGWTNTRSYGLGAIAYHGRSQLLRIAGNLNSTRYIDEVLQPQAIPFLQGLPGTWPAYSQDMSPIEHVWDIVGWRLAHDLRPVASTDELWLRIQTIWNTLPQADIQNLFNSMPRRVAALIAARGGHTKY
ncbi:transposable element Tcb2 transposase [Trichonephila clavipes]|nr:transposable element Tcb2 transposase [Trichonephila clavipes]